MPVNPVAENVFGYLGPFSPIILLNVPIQYLYRGIMLGYPVGTTNMEELEVQGHGRSITMAGVSLLAASFG